MLKYLKKIYKTQKNFKKMGRIHDYNKKIIFNDTMHIHIYLKSIYTYI